MFHVILLRFHCLKVNRETNQLTIADNAIHQSIRNANHYYMSPIYRILSLYTFPRYQNITLTVKQKN